MRGLPVEGPRTSNPVPTPTSTGRAALPLSKGRGRFRRPRRKSVRGLPGEVPLHDTVGASTKPTSKAPPLNPSPEGEDRVRVFRATIPGVTQTSTVGEGRRKGLPGSVPPVGTSRWSAQPPLNPSPGGEGRVRVSGQPRGLPGNRSPRVRQRSPLGEGAPDWVRVLLEKGRRKGLRGSPIKVTRDLRPGVSPSATQPPLPVALRALPAQLMPAAGLGRVGPALIHAPGAPRSACRWGRSAGGCGATATTATTTRGHENDPHFKWHTGLCPQAPPVPRPASIGSPTHPAPVSAVLRPAEVFRAYSQTDVSRCPSW